MPCAWRAAFRGRQPLAFPPPLPSSVQRGGNLPPCSGAPARVRTAKNFSCSLRRHPFLPGIGRGKSFSPMITTLFLARCRIRNCDGGDSMIGKKIAQLRTQHKLSQKELARRTGVSVATVKNWEGDSSDPCLENIKSLSNIFNVTTDSRLGQNENLRLYHEELEEEAIVLLNQISSNTWSTRSTAACARGPRRIRAAAVPLRCRRLPALFLLCLLPGGRNLGLVFSNSLKAAIPWTRRRSAGAASASSPPSPEEGRESACRTSTTSQAAPRERAASPSRKGPSLRGSRFPTAKRRDKSNTRRRRCATDRDMAHGVFHSKGDRPRGGTGGLRIRLCHHDLHDRKHPGVPAAGASARPVSAARS